MHPLQGLSYLPEYSFALSETFRKTFVFVDPHKPFKKAFSLEVLKDKSDVVLILKNDIIERNDSRIVVGDRIQLVRLHGLSHNLEHTYFLSDQ